MNLRILRVGALASVAFISIVALPVQAATVASWDFEEGSGSTVHDGVGGLNGTQTGGAWVASGNYNGALGTSLQMVRSEADKVLIPYSSQLSSLTSATFELWVKYAGGIPNYQDARLFNMPGADIWYYHDGDPGGTHGLRMTIGGGASGYDFGDPLTLNAWTQVVATYDQSDGHRRSYVNGVLHLDVPGGTGLALTGTDPIALGNDITGIKNFDGLIDHYSISDTALSNAQVLDRYNAIVNFTVPEPTSVAVLSLGGLLTLARRRRVA